MPTSQARKRHASVSLRAVAAELEIGVTRRHHDLWVVVRVVTKSLPGRYRPDPLFVGRYEGRYRLVKGR